MDKPFLNYKQQLLKLENEYGLIINDKESALEYLISLSYYDLVNGYKDIFMKNDKYIPDITMDDLVSFHFYNKNIQGVLIKFATYVENSFKNILANVIAEKFTADNSQYLESSNYQRGRSREKIRKFNCTIKKLKKTCRSCNNTPTSYYIETKDHIPPWILFRNTSFSVSADLFPFLKSTEKKRFIDTIEIFKNSALKYEQKVKLVIDSARLVRKFRNTIAHNLNFMFYRDSSLRSCVNTLFVNSLATEEEINKVRNDVWGMVMAMVILLNNKYLVNNFLSELDSYLDISEIIKDQYCNTVGIPLDYNKRIKRYLIELGLTEFTT